MLTRLVISGASRFFNPKYRIPTGLAKAVCIIFRTRLVEALNAVCAQQEQDFMMPKGHRKDRMCSLNGGAYTQTKSPYIKSLKCKLNHHANQQGLCGNCLQRDTFPTAARLKFLLKASQ